MLTFALGLVHAGAWMATTTPAFLGLSSSAGSLRRVSEGRPKA
jgi:hypothetical protein